MTPEDFIIDLGNGFCTPCIFPSALETDGSVMWLLGANFLRGWYSIHDQDNKRMGFVPLKSNLVTMSP